MKTRTGEKLYEVYRKKGIRLTEEMSPLLYDYFYAALKGKMWRGVHMFDKAHTVMLTEEGIIPKGVGVKILKALRRMEKEGVQVTRESLGGHMHCGEAYVAKVAGEKVAGWIHCARSSGDLAAVGSRIDARDIIIAIMKELVDLRKTLLGKAEEHIDTVMPGYTHLQHAEPITFGFYLLSWVHPLERDFERLEMAYKRTNISPAGCAILTTTDFPINRKTTQELLGFDDMYTNAKDAIWSQDYVVEILSVLVGMVGTLGRLADDLNVWQSSEFRMIEHPDALCGTSSIMPQKKNPYGTECIRGLNADVIGRVMSFLSMTKCQSDACEMVTMAPLCLYGGAEETLAVLRLVNGLVKGLKVNKETMRERAGMFWSQGASVANRIVMDKKVPFRLAHQIVGVLVRMAYEEGKEPEDVTSEMVDEAAKELEARPLHLSRESLREALDPVAIVGSKKAVGGTAPERVREDIVSSIERVKRDERVAASLETKLATAEKKLEAAIDKILGSRKHRIMR